MNTTHKAGKLKNRLNRCKKRLNDKDIPVEQKHRLSQRVLELEDQLSEK